MKSHPRPDLVRLTIEHFQPLYDYTLSEADIDEIIESLAAYGRVLREIKGSLEAPKSPALIPGAFPQSTQVSTVSTLVTFQRTGQVK